MSLGMVSLQEPPAESHGPWLVYCRTCNGTRYEKSRRAADEYSAWHATSKAEEHHKTFVVYSDVWYGVVEGERFGPIGERSLLERINHHDRRALVWTPGMDDWAEAHRVFALSTNAEDSFQRMQTAMELTSSGNHLGEQGLTEQAVACFNQAINIHPHWVPAYLGLAVALREQGKFDEALEVLERAPKRAEVEEGVFVDMRLPILHGKAAFYLQSGEKAKAIEYLRKALEVEDTPQNREMTERARRWGLDPGPLLDVDSMRSMVEQLLNELESEELEAAESSSLRRESTSPPAATVSSRGRDPQTNGYATAGLVLGILAVFLFESFSIFPVAAVIVSWIGVRKANERGGAGRKKAWAGLILGCLYTMMYFLQPLVSR